MVSCNTILEIENWCFSTEISICLCDNFMNDNFLLSWNVQLNNISNLTFFKICTSFKSRYFVARSLVKEFIKEVGQSLPGHVPEHVLRKCFFRFYGSSSLRQTQKLTFLLYKFLDLPLCNLFKIRPYWYYTKFCSGNKI